ncbi:coiled-coil domain containing 114 [Plakobranchus ocellatus]|uniref:Coiled-coil domain containing 114 n=1 Tax=Plakobranchus ocellatus TaxID=259542 RepID=A0AAV4A1D7_9GAST|nr:coiled-coil domain containing 114 [Plakobranchus ocellatus]
MDVAEIMELEKQKEQLATDEKAKAKMKRQIRIFNKEKESYYHHTRHELSKQRRALTVLENERDIELANYIATRSEAIEKRYRREEAVVRDLVQTTDDVIGWLNKEKDTAKFLYKEIKSLDKEKWDCKKETMKNVIEQSTFRLPDRRKMDSRVERASMKYHIQLNKNKELQDKIDVAIYLRSKYMKEEEKLLKQLDELKHEVSQTMHTTAEIYEQRDRAEATKVKVRDHLQKVKDQYQGELLNLSLTLSDNKKMEAFMRTKHKDNTKYLVQQRQNDLSKAIEMVHEKDEFTLAFDKIKEATGKSDLNQIVSDFIEAEEDNFCLFLSIGDILDENERIRVSLKEMQRENTHMEETEIKNSEVKSQKIAESQERILDLKKRCEAYKERMAEQSQTLEEFTQQVQKMISPYLSSVIVCPQTRAVFRNKSEATADEKMICRVPSDHIDQRVNPVVKPASLLKEKEELEDVKLLGPLDHGSARNMAVTSLLERAASRMSKVHVKTSYPQKHGKH